MARRVFITVAEASADLHAANLLRALRTLVPDVSAEALGGPRLAEAGAQVHRDTVQRAAMGWRAMLRAAEVHRLLRWARERWRAHRPDLVICCDSWSMNWHFARLARELRVPVLYYIAPQTWASREGRVQRLARHTDRVACIWPFEEPYFRRHGVSATFVGHPLFDELPREREPLPIRRVTEPPVVGLLPGSRRSIASANFPRQLEAARKIRAEFPDARFLVPTTPVTHPVVERLAAGFAGMTLGLGEFDELVPRCHLAICVSGTATLHAAAYGVPMIVVYRGSRVLWNLVGRWVIKTRTFNMINFLSGSPTHLIPEIIPWSGSGDAVGYLATDYLNHPEKLEHQREQVQRVVRTLDRPGASLNAARLAMEMMG